MFVCPECGSRFPAPGFCTEDGVSLVDGHDDPLLGSTLGNYRVTAKVGQGGMGTVYRAVHPGIGSRVAVKVLSQECASSPALVERFFAEARAVNLIRHENIVSVLDLAALPDGRPYIVMELLEGCSLAELIAQGQLPLGSVVTMLTELLAGLSAAHSKGIVHRDLKPDNLFLTRAGRLKILDFGIAKLRPELGGISDATRTGSLMGTPFYMSPEQAAGMPVDPRSDLYSVGVILFEAVTGERPFEVNSLYELLKAHVELMPPAPSALRYDVPQALEQVLLLALQKDANYRYQTCEDFSAALAHAAHTLLPESFVPSATLVSAAKGKPPRGSSAVGSSPVAASPRFGETPATLVRTPFAKPRVDPAPTKESGGGRRFGYFAMSTCGLIVLATLGSCVTCFGFALFREEKTVTVALGGGQTAEIQPASFEVTAFAGHATSAAQKQAPDARLARIWANGKWKQSSLDLTGSPSSRVVYSFRTGAECLNVEVSQAGLTTRKDDDCPERTLSAPRCSVEAVWKRVIDAGGPQGYTNGTLVYSAGLDGRGSWRVTADRFDDSVNDDC